jgi:hypothetical protein
VLFVQSAMLLDFMRAEKWRLPQSLVMLKRSRTDAGDAAVQLDLQDWLDWHRSIALPSGETAMQKLRKRAEGELPLVSVCLVHYNRPRLLSQALDSLRAQDYPRFEVILVDDGSPGAEARQFLESLLPEFSARGWRIVQKENDYLGAARNTAVKSARGEYLLFMDDDNYAKPHELSTFVAAAEHSGADILTCHMDCFAAESPPQAGETVVEEWGPLGAALAVGVFENVFGDANALWKKSAFVAAGGYTELYGVGHEDWELFARAVLLGLELEAVPESLFYYRVLPGSMLGSTAVSANLLRSLRPYLQTGAPWLRQVVAAAAGQHRALYRPSNLQRIVSDVAPVSDDELFALRARIERLLRPFPRVRGLARRSMRAILKLADS